MKPLRLHFLPSGSLLSSLHNCTKPLPDCISSVTPQYISNPRDRPETGITPYKKRREWVHPNKPLPPWGKHTQHPHPLLGWTFPVGGGPWGYLQLSKGGSLLGLPTALGKAVGPKGKSVHLGFLICKMHNNTCPTHITGWLGRSNKTYLGAVFKSTKHYIHGYGLTPNMRCWPAHSHSVLCTNQALQHWTIRAPFDIFAKLIYFLGEKTK